MTLAGVLGFPEIGNSGDTLNISDGKIDNKLRVPATSKIREYTYLTTTYIDLGASHPGSR